MNLLLSSKLSGDQRLQDRQAEVDEGQQELSVIETKAVTDFVYMMMSGWRGRM